MSAPARKRKAKTHVHMPSLHLRRADGSGVDVEEDLYFDERIRRGLPQEPHELADWALNAITEEYGLNQAEIAAVVGALEYCIMERQALQLARAQDRERGEPMCLNCGCTQSHACEGGCFWASPNLCSRCV